MNNTPEISILIPCYNSEQSISSVIECICSLLKHTAFELVLVNDGSKDNTQKKLDLLAKKYGKIITVIELKENYGEFNAVMCGFNFVNGEYIINIDDDFQQHPEDILTLYHSIKKTDLDVLYAKYKQSKYSNFRNATSVITHKIINLIYGLSLHMTISSFKIIKKPIIEKIIKYTGPYPHIDGLILKHTKRIANIQVEHHERKHGKSNYTFGKLINYFITILAAHNVITIIASTIVLLYFGICLILAKSHFILFIFCLNLLLTCLLINRYLISNYSSKKQYEIKSIISQKKDSL